MPPVHEWETWPFQGELQPQPLAPPVDAEPARNGQGGVDCWHCAHGDDETLWENDNWLVTPLMSGSAPISLRRWISFDVN